MPLHPTYDVCVIGAGVVGSSAARYLASRGQKTLLLEQVSFKDCSNIHQQSVVVWMSW